MRWKLIRSVKQGIDHSIANHIENLTSRWMREDQINTHTKEVYERGMGVYKIWAKQHNRPVTMMEEDNGDVSSTLWDDTSANSDTENSHDEIQKKIFKKSKKLLRLHHV